jgi:hypothetical protein
MIHGDFHVCPNFAASAESEWAAGRCHVSTSS